jgi:hypothetical protein
MSEKTNPTEITDASNNNKPCIENEILFVDVVGVDCGLGGRSCNQHMCCGHSIQIGDKLVCKWNVGIVPQKWRAKPPPNEEGVVEMEEQVKVYKLIEDGLVSCQIGYLPRRLFKQKAALLFDLSYLRVTEDLRLSYSKHERTRSTRFLGIVSCQVIYNNPNYNGHNPFEGDSCNVSVSGTVPSYSEEIVRINKESTETELNTANDLSKVLYSPPIITTNTKENQANSSNINEAPIKKKRRTCSDKGKPKKKKIVINTENSSITAPLLETINKQPINTLTTNDNALSAAQSSPPNL